MVHKNVIAETPVAAHSEIARLRAKVLVAGSADCAFTTTAPTIDNATIADLNAGRVGSQLVHHADDLMSENAGRLDYTGQIDLPLATEVQVSFGQMDVRVAHAARAHPEQHLSSDRDGRRFDNLCQRRAKFREFVTAHPASCIHDPTSVIVAAQAATNEWSPELDESEQSLFFNKNRDAD
jgi:hypothetical protein